MTNEQSQNGGRYQIDKITYAKRGVLKICTCAYKNGGGEVRSKNLP